MLEPTRQMASEIPEAICFFSTGRDSAVMLDMCVKYIKRLHVVFLYFVRGLEFKERYIKAIEKRYGITVDQYPLPQALNYVTGKRYRMSDIETQMREKYNVSYIALGYRKDESVYRRIMLNATDNGIDRKTKKLYPLMDFNRSTIDQYVRRERIILSPEYNFGFRNIDVPRKGELEWIKNNYPDDFKRIIQTFPMMEAELYHE